MRMRAVLLLLFFTTLQSAGQSFTIAVNLPSQCYSSPGNTLTAWVTVTAPGATTYSWSVNTSTCSITGLTPSGANSSTATITFSCCGTGTVACTALNGTASVGTATATFTIGCPPPLAIIANPASNTICSGSPASLAASGGVTYSWSTGSFSSSIGVTPTSAVPCFTLWGIGSNSCSGTATKCYSVLATPALTVTGPNSMCAGTSATLTASGGATYTWSPGNIVGANLVISPAVTTCYTVTAQSPAGCYTTFQKCVTVLTPPTISISGPSVVCAGGNVILAASGANTYTWSTGSNSASTAVSPTATTTFSVSGTAGNGCTGLATKNVSVTPQPTVTAASSVNGNNALFAATVSPLYTPATYSWSFGNGNTYTATGTSTASTSYSASGTYTYYVYYTGPGGCTGAYADTVAISITPCTVTANFSSSLGPGGVVMFTSTSTGTGSSTAYYWNFGDGGSSTLSATSHTYLSSGNYNVKLDVQNPGCFDSIVKVVAVSIYTCNLSANFSYSTAGSGQVSFTSTSAGAQPGYYYQWTIGNSTYTGSTALHTFTASGNYPVTLYVASSAASPSCFSTYSATVSVSITPCAISPAISHTAGLSGQVNFASTSTGTFSGSTFLWDFGDGTGGTGASPVHFYTNGGTHYVTLIVTNPGGVCADTLTQAINITGISCTANSGFLLFPTQTPHYWTAMPFYPWNVSNAVWSWGDGSTSNGLYTAHQYSAAGNYNICLSVTVSCQASSSACATYSVYRPSSGSAIVYVNVLPPSTMITGVEDQEQAPEVLVYPNPSHGTFFIRGEGLTGKGHIAVYDLQGRMIHSEAIDPGTPAFEREIVLDTGPGIYFIRLVSGSHTHSSKVIVTGNQ